MNLARRTFSSPSSALSRPLRMLLAVTFIAVAAGITPLAFAQPAGMHPAMAGGLGIGGPHMSGRMLDLVGATTEQRAHIKAIMDAAHTAAKAQRDAAQPLKTQLKDLFTKATVDAAAAESLRKQLQPFHNEIGRIMLKAMVDSANVLTLAQRQALAEHLAKREAMHRPPKQ